MSGRQLLSENDYIHPGYNPGHPDMVRRRVVLKETIHRFENARPQNQYELTAQTNLKRWSNERTTTNSDVGIHVVSGDWGEVALHMTKKYGECFAVLNMANAYVPGGAYVEGAVAQEENMFRRTNCHFYIGPSEYNADLDRYLPETTSLLSAENGKVYLDTQHPRICIRGPERSTEPALGYEWLANEDIFPFFELRASAQDLRDGSSFCEANMRKRVAAQLETLIAHNIRHVVFGAFGCGAFRNPAEKVATLYREEIAKRQNSFTVVVFGIYDAGYGPDNYTPFNKVFATKRD
jgi:hypothetical protein